MRWKFGEVSCIKEFVSGSPKSMRFYLLPHHRKADKKMESEDYKL
jgi:hypothetical protein